MKPKAKKYLYDMYQAIVELEEIIKVFDNSFNKYKVNLTAKRAVERELEIIGEALNKAVQEDPTIVIEGQQKIISLRNYIIHAYDSVQDEIIWGIVIKNVPVLKYELAGLLEI